MIDNLSWFRKLRNSECLSPESSTSAADLYPSHSYNKIDSRLLKRRPVPFRDSLVVIYILLATMTLISGQELRQETRRHSERSDIHDNRVQTKDVAKRQEEASDGYLNLSSAYLNLIDGQHTLTGQYLGTHKTTFITGIKSILSDNRGGRYFLHDLW